MEALIIEHPGWEAPDWLVELADELVEDPQCGLVLLGSDADGVVLVTIWDAEMASEVEAGLRELTESGVRLRRLTMVDPRTPGGLL